MPWLIGLSAFGRSHLRNIFLSPDSGDGAGGDGTGGDPPSGGDEKKYTDKDLATHVTRRLKQTKKELDAKDTTIAAKDSQIADLQAQIDAIGANGDADAEARKKAGTLEVEKKKLEAQVADLQLQTKSLHDRLTQENERRRGVERDQALRGALAKINCIDVDTALIIFRDRVEYDEEEEKWYYRTTSGNTVEVDAGVNAECPDYLRPANMRGGSGATGGNTRKNASVKRLDDLRKQKAEAERRLSREPRNSAAMTQIRRLSREIGELENSLK